jgi:hypothetical protein
MLLPFAIGLKRSAELGGHFDLRLRLSLALLALQLSLFPSLRLILRRALRLPLRLWGTRRLTLGLSRLQLRRCRRLSRRLALLRLRLRRRLTLRLCLRLRRRLRPRGRHSAFDGGYERERAGRHNSRQQPRTRAEPSMRFHGISLSAMSEFSGGTNQACTCSGTQRQKCRLLPSLA